MIDLTREKPMHINEVAEFLGVCRKTVGKYFNDGLEYAKVGRLKVTTREAIQRFAEHNHGPDHRPKPQAISRERLKRLEERKAKFGA